MVLLDAATARHTAAVVNVAVDVVIFRAPFYDYGLTCASFTQILTGVTV